MRKKLKRIIKHRFGPTYGMKKLRETREEIIANALDRFDEELQNGASEQDAKETVLAALGNIHELRGHLGLDKRGKRIRILTVVFITAFLIIADFAVAVKTGDTMVLFMFQICVPVLLLTAGCVLCVMFRPGKRTFWISALVVISFILYYVLAYTVIAAVHSFRDHASENRVSDARTNTRVTFSLADHGSEGEELYQ